MYKKTGEIETSFTDLYSTDAIIKKIKELFDPKIKYVLVIDELDRCDPKYVLKLFNIIKHFFDIYNLSIVYFYNFSELWQIISKEYGYTDESYIQKYVDYEIKLNESYNHEYFRDLDERFLYTAIRFCSALFKLTLRENKNLLFLAEQYNTHNFQNYYYVLALCCFVIKRICKEDFNYEIVENNVHNLKTIYDYDYISLVLKEIKKQFDYADETQLKIFLRDLVY